MADFWRQRFNTNDNTYECPWCHRGLKSKLSKSAKNPDKVFVSCAKDFGGCGLFCFLDSVPNDKFKPNTNKRPKTDDDPQPGGNNVIGPIVNNPDVHEVRLAELAAKVDNLASQLGKVEEGLRKVLEYLEQ